MPRILRIHNRLIIGGPTLHVLNLTKFLPPEFETLLLVGKKEAHEKDASYLAEEMGVRTVAVPAMGRSMNPYGDYQAYRQVKRIIREFKPDIVHTHAAKPGAVGRMAAQALRPVIVHTYHGHVFHSYFNTTKTQFIIRTERFLAKKTDALIAISNQQKQELVDDFKIARPDKFRIIPLGFELDKFFEGQPGKRQKFREEFRLSDDELAIGIVGRLVPVKNHFLFIDALHYALQHSKQPICGFIIGDGDNRRALEIHARGLGIIFSHRRDDPGVQLVFTSWRQDIDVVNAGLDIVAMTSLNEGTPVSLIEAQAANKPIVSTRVGGITDIVLENKTALLSDVNDTDSFRQNLMSLINDATLRGQLSTAGKDFVQKKYGIERLVNDVSRLYAELLSAKKKN